MAHPARPAWTRSDLVFLVAGALAVAFFFGLGINLYG